MGGVVERIFRAAVIAALPLSVFAQTQTPSTQTLRDRDRDLEGAKRVLSEIQQANIHSGRFYMFSRIRIADAGFNEDYYLPTGGVRGGFNFRVEAPQRLYFVPHRKTVFTLDAVPAYSFLRQSHRNGQFDYSLRGDAHFLFNHLYLDAYALLTDQLRAQIADVNRIATQKENEYGLGGEMKYSSRTSAFFSARFRDVSFPSNRLQPDNVPVNLLDRSERNGRVSLYHKTFPLTSLFVAAEASDYEFVRATYKDSTRRYVGAGFLRASGRTSFRVEGGRTQLNFSDPNRRDFSGPTGEAVLNRGAGRWNYNLRGAREIGFSIFADNDYYKATQARFGVDYNATRKLTLRASHTRERDDYDNSVNGLLRRDDLSFTSIGFMYGMRRLSFGVDGGYFERESNFLADDSGIRWVIHLSFTP